VPNGGASGAVLTKNTATSYDAAWVAPFTQAAADARYLTPATAASTYLPLAGGTLTGNLLFSADNTKDIGASAASRPRNVNVAGAVVTPVVGTPLVQSSTILQLGSSNAARWRVHTTGDLWAETDNTYDIGAAGSVRPRNLYLGGRVTVGGVNEYIRNPVNALNNLSIESIDGNLMLSGKLSVAMGGNAYWDGTNWQRIDVAQPAMIWAMGAGTATLYGSAAGSNPITGLTTLLSANAATSVVEAPAFRATANAAPTAGVGMELYWNGTSSVVQSYNRTSATYQQLTLLGSQTLLGYMSGGWVSISPSAGVVGNVAAAPLAFYSGVGPKINLFDAGGGSFFGFGINSGEFVISCPATLNIRNASMSSAVISSLSNAGAWTAASFTPSSSRKIKSDIQLFADPLEVVTDDRVHAVRYTSLTTGERSVGFIADDWAPVLPEVVVLDDIGDVAALDYDRISAVTFEALKQYVMHTNARLDALERNLVA
jgi:hypothetical protein